MFEAWNILSALLGLAQVGLFDVDDFSLLGLPMYVLGLPMYILGLPMYVLRLRKYVLGLDPYLG